MAKLDLYRKFAREYVARRTPRLIATGRAKYLAISGRGSPKAAAFTAAIGALYGVAFTIKMARKFAGQDYAVAKLEGLWWGGVRGRPLIDSPASTWRWQVMIRVPAFIGARDRAQALRTLAQRGKGPLVRRVKLIALREGRVVQMLHVGPYDREHATLRAMHDLARAEGLRVAGRHHEIYLSDPSRVPPARLRTILRQPVR